MVVRKHLYESEIFMGCMSFVKFVYICTRRQPFGEGIMAFQCHPHRQRNATLYPGGTEWSFSLTIFLEMVLMYFASKITHAYVRVFVV